MSVIEIILTAAIVLFGIFIYIKAFRIFCILEVVCELPLFPVRKLAKLISEHDFISAFSKILKWSIMILVFIGSVIYIIVSLASTGNASDSFMTIFNGTALGGFLQLVAGDHSISGNVNYAAMVSAGLSSFISFLYMRCTVDALDSLERVDKHSPIYWIIIVLFNVAFMFLSSILGEQLSQWCSAAADYVLALYQKLVYALDHGTVDTFWGIVKAIGIGLFLLVMLYAALVTFSVVLREYFATILYGIFTLAALIAGGLIFQVWLGWPGIITGIIFFGSIIFTEYVRASDDANRKFKSFITNLA